jgi:hypothetical protein
LPETHEDGRRTVGPEFRRPEEAAMEIPELLERL